MAMYVSKVWGFDNPCGPLVFNSDGWRLNAAQRLKPGDCVVLVGTWGDETAPSDRNRVLGMMEPSTVPVATSDFIVPHRADRRLFRENGAYRWPYGLLNYRAWEFAPGLFLNAVALREGNPFGSAAAAGIVPLTPEEEARVRAHVHHEIPLLQSISADRKLYGKDAARRRGAPVPAENARRGVMHMRRGAAYVYWFHLVTDGKIAGHKIGWAFDWEQRLGQFNAVSLGALGGLRYKVQSHQQFDTARLAFRVEQEVLRILDKHRHPANQEVLTGIRREAVAEVWDRCIVAAMLGRR